MYNSVLLNINTRSTPKTWLAKFKNMQILQPPYSRKQRYI